MSDYVRRLRAAIAAETELDAADAVAVKRFCAACRVGHTVEWTHGEHMRHGDVERFGANQP